MKLDRNQRLAELLGNIEVIQIGILQHLSFPVVRSDTHGGYEAFIPCEKWAQLMPLVIENFNDDAWVDLSVRQKAKRYSKNKQLAVVDCLIDILERKNNG